MSNNVAVTCAEVSCVLFSARNVYTVKKILHKKALYQTCKLLVQVDLYKFLDRVSGALHHIFAKSTAIYDGLVMLCACQIVVSQSRSSVHGQLATGRRPQCGSVRRYKDALKVNMK